MNPLIKEMINTTIDIRSKVIFKESTEEVLAETRKLLALINKLATEVKE